MNDTFSNAGRGILRAAFYAFLLMLTPPAARALTITGTVSTAASPVGLVPPAGKIIVKASSTTTSTSASASLMVPGPFTITSLPSGQSYNLTAFIDANNNQTLDPSEWTASYSSNPIVLSADKPDANITITASDSDGDGLSDLDEMNIHGTNPLSADTDGDGIPDKYEVDHHLDPRRDDTKEDRDFDFVSNIDEYKNGSNPNSAYSDTSGSSDYQKLNDGQSMWESMYDRNDRLLGVRYDRGMALGYAYDGNGNMVRQTKLSLTSVGDGLPAPWKIAYGLDPYSSAPANGPSGDPDGDGWSNYQEFMAGTDPTSATSHPGGDSTVIASATTPFIPTHFVAATGQLDGTGPDELAVGADGDPGSQANAIKVYTKTDTGWTVESIPVGSFGVTSLAIGKPAGASANAIYAGLRSSTATGSIVELKKSGATWTTTPLVSSTDAAAYVIGLLNDIDLIVNLSKAGDNAQASYKLSIPSQLTLFSSEASTSGRGTTGGKLSANRCVIRIKDSGGVQLLTHSGTIPNGAIYNSQNEAYYFLTPTASGWQSAETYAQTFCAHLTTVNDVTKRSWLASNFITGGSLWIGLYRDAGSDRSNPTSWKWSSGIPSAYSTMGSMPWEIGEPNNQTGNDRWVSIYTPSSKWYDNPDSDPAKGIVEVNGNNVISSDITAIGKLYGLGHAATCGLIRTGVTTTGVDGMSVFSAFVDDLNANGTADANDQFTVSEFLISGTAATLQNTYRLPMPDNVSGLNYSLTTFKQLGGTTDVLATGEPDGGLYLWEGPKTSGPLGRRLIERHGGKLWHDLVSHQGTETGEGLVGLEVDQANPATCNVNYWSPDALDRFLSKPFPQNPPGTKLLSNIISGGAYPLVNVKIWDAESNAAHPTLQWQNMATGQWNDATLLSLDGIAYSASTSCVSSPSGTEHTIAWNAAQDLGLSFKSGLMLRARSSDASGYGAWSAATFYFVDLTRDSRNDGLPDNWKLANNLDLNLTNPMDDYSSDGVSNLMKFALGLNPRQSSVEGMPSPSKEGDYLTLTVPRNAAAANLLFDVQVSGSMSTWESGPDDVTILENSPARLKARDNIPISSSSKRFIRLAVTPQAPALPSITQQPATVAILPGTTTTLSTSAQGSSLAYQWESGTPGGMFQQILGANSATYTTPPLSTDTFYRVIVTNSFGSSLSEVARVWPTTYIAISKQPRSQSVESGANITFEVSVVGVAAGYQWKKNGNAIAGATNSTLSIQNIQMQDAGSYSVSITGAQYSVASNTALLKVTPEPGNAYAFGIDQHGELGNGLPDTKVPAAVYMNGVLTGKQVVTLASGGGGAHNLALTSDGKVYSWGGNDSGQLGDGTTTNRLLPVAVNMSGALLGKTVIAIAAGDRHSLAITSDGKVYAWGDNNSGQLGDGTTTQRILPVAVNMSGALLGKTVTNICAGSSHSLAQTSQGKVYAWGDNNSGQLGDGTTTQRILPVAVNMSGVLLGKTVTSIASGAWHSLALTSEGKVYAWGSNSSAFMPFDGGQLGDGTTTQRTLPVSVNMSGVLLGKTVTSIAAGIWQSFALTTEGKVYGWGGNDSGQLGNGTTTSSALPVLVNTSPVIGGQTVISISAGIFHCLALTSGGQVIAWGGNEDGCLGDGTDTWQTTPVLVKMDGVLLGKSVVLVEAGSSASLAMTSDGLCYAWGRHSSGQLGNGYSTYRSNAVALYMSGDLSGKRTSAISAGWSHGLALTPEGGVYAWGSNSQGQLGNGAFSAPSIPIPVDTGSEVVVSVAGGSSHSLALTQDGKVYSWGDNSNGQLGDGTYTQSTSPVVVNLNDQLSEESIIAIQASGESSLALSSDGRVYAWGYNYYGQLGDGTTTRKSTPVAVDTSGVLNGQTVVAIAAGVNHCLAISSEGKVFAWGSNSHGQLGDGTTTQRNLPVAVNMSGALLGKTVIAIAAGERYSLAITSEGKAYSWGWNASGQLGDGTTTQRTLPVAVNIGGVLSGKTITAIAVGHQHCLALTTDGKAYSWGANSNGQLGDGSTSVRSTPVQVDMTGNLQGKTITAISAGGSFSVLIATP
jgi:YD repeat-containing protein